MAKSEYLSNNTENEIDLIELIKVLWAKKLWIILSAFLFAAIAGVYAFTAQEKWTSKSEVIPPRLQDLGSYWNIRKEYARILHSEFNTGDFAGGLFANFDRYLYSQDEREAFFKQSEMYKKLAEGKSEKEQKTLLSKLALENISITKPDAKKEPDLIGRRISLYSTTPEMAQSTLKDFISFINQKTYQMALTHFLIEFNEKVEDLKYEKLSIERNLAIQNNVQLENLNKAYETAEKAGIKEYSKALSDNNVAFQNLAISDTKIPLSDSKLSDGTYLFMLGEKYLKAQIDVASKKEIVYPPRYYQIQEQLKELEPLLAKAKSANGQTFSYLSAPDYPVERDWPKRVILLALGFILGSILSSLIILVFSILKKEK